MRLCIALQFWDGDREKALQNARLIADMEDGKRDDIDFLFSCRFDSSHDQKIIDYVAKKFNVYTHKSRIAGKGHPNGCNLLWQDTMKYGYEMKRQKRAAWSHFLTIEADANPTRKTWINELVEEFKQAKKRIMGHIMTLPTPHINGNAIFDLWLSFTHPSIYAGFREYSAWDIELAQTFLPLANDSKLFFNDYRKDTITKEELFAPKRDGVIPALYHGVRDDSAIKIIREEYSLK